MNPQLFAELQELITGLCERTLSAAQKARLEELVCTNDEFCEYYIKVMHVEAALPRYVGASVRSAAAVVAEWQLRQGSTHDAVLDAWGRCDLRDLPNATISADSGAQSASSPTTAQSLTSFATTSMLFPLQRLFLRGSGIMARAAAILVLVGTLCAGVLLGALAVAAVPQWRDDATHANSEVTLLGSTGAGFTTSICSLMQHSVDPDSDAPVLPKTVPTNYVHTVSNETLALFGATPKRVIWQLRCAGGLLDGHPGNRRVVIGLRNGETPAANLFLPGSGDPAQAGLWVFLTNGVNITPYTIKLALHGNLVFVNAAGEAKLLATWDWAQFDMSSHPNITANLDTSATHYALSFDQEVVNVVGTLNGRLPSEAPTSARIGVFDQIGGGDVSGSVVVDRIAIANVPAKDSRTFGDVSISNVGSKVAE
jgi:hypothetical protein